MKNDRIARSLTLWEEEKRRERNARLREWVRSGRTFEALFEERRAASGGEKEQFPKARGEEEHTALPGFFA